MGGTHETRPSRISGLLVVAGTVLFLLKLLGLVDWSWDTVLAPWYLLGALYVAAIVIGLVFAACEMVIERRIRRLDEEGDHGRA